MKVLSSFSELRSLQTAVCTIGNFDGIHLGHLFLFEKMRKIAGSDPTVVITFSNHPLEILYPEKAPKLISSIQHKLALFKSVDVDYVVLLEFTEKLAKETYVEFLENLKNCVNFTHLILGKGSAFGKKKEGTEENIKKLCEPLGFKVHYLENLPIDEKAVSSGRIRNCIKEGKISEASQLLSRPYSIYLDPLEAPLEKLLLPPAGQYPVYIGEEKTPKKAVIIPSYPYIMIEGKALSSSSPIEITFLG